MSCPAGSETVIIYTSKAGVKTKFIANDSPVTIECVDKPRTGRFIYTVKSSGYIFGSCTPIGDRGYGLTVAADTYTNETPPPQPPYENCFFTTFKYFIGEEKVGEFLATSDYINTAVLNPDYSKGGKFLVVKNAQGNKIFEAEVKDCDHEVSCGDECPPGHIRCEHKAYPGYCCIPCQGTASKINNLASKVGK